MHLRTSDWYRTLIARFARRHGALWQMPRQFRMHCHASCAQYVAAGPTVMLKNHRKIMSRDKRSYKLSTLVKCQTFLLKASNVVEHPHSSIFRDDFHSKATVFNSFSNWFAFNLAFAFSSWFAVFSIIVSDKVSFINLLSYLCFPLFWMLFVLKSCPKELTRCRSRKLKCKYTIGEYLISLLLNYASKHITSTFVIKIVYTYF